MRLQLKVAVLAVGCVLAATALARADAAPGEHELFGRLLAPCCWNQTLEVHDSEIARQLRAELRVRLMAGEAPQAIERDLVLRYGERILAVPGRDSRQDIVWLVLVAMIAALLGLVAAGRRWRARSSPERDELAAQSIAADPRLDALIEAELEERSV